ncbi:MAG: CPBP family intramembrane glutamic endopeptidase [Coriobacteriia bacterium]
MSSTGREMTSKTVVWLFILTFAITWGLGMLYVSVPQVEQIFGPMSATSRIFLLMVWAPAIASFALIVRHYGWQGLGKFLRRLTLWRMPLGWWAFIALGMPALFYAAAAMSGTLPTSFPFDPWYAVFPALGLTLITGPVEEIGWRGVALPVLQRRFSPLAAALLIGAVWGVWHAPSFLMSGSPQDGWAFGPFFVSLLAASVIMTAMFNASRGSLLTDMLFHFTMNNPIWPDGQPWFALLISSVAIGVVIVNRKTMLTKGAGETSVLALPATNSAASAHAGDPR